MIPVQESNQYLTLKATMDLMFLSSNNSFI